MTLLIYRTSKRLTCSIVRVELVAEVETDRFPEDPLAFADRYGGDFIEVAPMDAPNGDENDSADTRQDGNS